MGVALMVIGILFSAGYSKVVSINTSGLLYSRHEDFTKNNNQENKENTLLWINEPTKIGDYYATYHGKRLEAEGVPGFIPADAVITTDNPRVVLAKEDIAHQGKVYHKKEIRFVLLPKIYTTPLSTAMQRSINYPYPKGTD